MKEALKDFIKLVLVFQDKQDTPCDSIAYENHLALNNSSLFFINKTAIRLLFIYTHI